MYNNTKGAEIMFNTLKEMQETIPYEDLCKYTYESVGKAPKGIIELLKSHDIEVTDSVAQECYDFIKELRTMEDDELENVAGGTCYSSGVTDPESGITREYVIVTVGNACPLNGMTDWITNNWCGPCGSSFGIGATLYCNRRWRGHNTPRVFHDRGVKGESVGFDDD